jgi:hypothetical protein
VSDPIQDSEHGELLAAIPAVLSSVQLDTTSKGFAMVRVKVYSGETEEEMDRLKNLAVVTYNKTIAMLGARANL